MSETGLKRLEAWVQAKNLAVFVYQNVVPCFPPDEKWGLSAQLKRSASSIPANIAEGYGRYYYQSNIQFCYNARGSLQETISHVLLAAELGFLPPEIYAAFNEKTEALTILLNGYIAYLKNLKLDQMKLTSRSMKFKQITSLLIHSWKVVTNDFDNSPFSIFQSQFARRQICIIDV